MDVSSYVAKNPNFNCSLADGRALLAKLTSAGYQAALFANPVSLGGGLMVPDDVNQNDYSAMWTDPSNDCSGTDPSVPVYLQVWVEQDAQQNPLQNYYTAAGVIQALAKGETLVQALS